jgi:ketosteroid isomerase-like protein
LARYSFPGGTHSDTRGVASSATSGLVALALFCGSLVGCGKTATDTDTASANAQGEAEIRSLLAATEKAAASKDMKAYMLYYHPDAALVMPNGPITFGIKPGAGERPFPQPYEIAMKTHKVEVSGDLGYALGTYEQTMPDPVTKVVEFSVGKWMTVFKRQENGKWGAIADTYNVETSKPVTDIPTESTSP